MNLNQTITLSPDVISQEVSGETVLLDLESEHYFGLDEVGTRIWQLAQETDDLNAIYQTLLAEYDVAENRLQQDLGQDFQSPKFVQLDNHKTVWKYRGQILSSVKEMHLEAHIKTLERRGSRLVMLADAYLWNGKMRIYQVTDLALAIEEA